MPPLLLPLTAFCIGIILSYSGAPWWISMAIAIAGLAVYLYLTLKGRDPMAAFKSSKYHYIWVALFFIAAGSFDCLLSMPCSLHENGNFQPLPEGSMAVAIVNNVRTVEYGERLEIEVVKFILPDKSEVSTRNFKSLIYTETTVLKPGDIITFPASFKPVADSPNHPGRNVADALKNKGIYYTANSRSYNIRNIGHRNSPRIAAINLRDRIEITVEKSGLSRPTVNFIIAILLGDKDFLSPDSRAAFADAGISHVLALSGMHTAIIAGIILWLLFPINFAGYFKWRIGIATFLLWGYAFIAGLSPSIVRACLMATFLFGSIALERKNTSLNSLCGAALVILACNPYALFDIGLQMSAACVAAIILLVRPLNVIDQHSHSRLYKINGIFLTTLCATAVTWVISAWYFQRLPLLFIPANMIALPFLPIFISVVIGYLILIQISPFFLFIGNIIDFTFGIFIKFIEWISAGGSSALTISLPSSTVVFWLLGILGFAIFLNFRRNKAVFLLSSLLLFISIGCMAFSKNERREGIVIQDRFDRVAVTVYDNIGEDILLPEAGCVSTLSYNGRKFMFADRALTEIVSKDSLLPEMDYLVLSKGFKGDIHDVIATTRPGMIVIHNSIFRKRESKLIQQADSLRIPTHSIRARGPLHIKAITNTK